jgi:hypothetical protein
MSIAGLRIRPGLENDTAYLECTGKDLRWLAEGIVVEKWN